MDELLRLEPTEARVLGVLIEKSLTTPDGYPLSVNAATAGANQKSNRDPVLDLSESEVAGTLETLVLRRYVGRVHPAGGRVEKFRHNAEERLHVAAPQLAILAELLLRGPQTKGELRTRAGRMHAFDDVAALSEGLAPLLEKGFARRLDPAPGSRAERYEQLLSPGLHGQGDAPAAASPAASSSAAPPSAAPAAPGLAARVEALEGELATLRRQLAALADKLGEPLEG